MFRAVVVSSVLALTAIPTGSTLLFAQAAAAAKPAAPAPATAESAAAFLGDWTLTMQGPSGPATFALTVKVDAAKVAGEISSDVLPVQAITDISTSGPGLILRYQFDYQGNSVSAVVSLTPAGEKVDAQIDFADGAYVLTGAAVKKAK